MRPELPQLDMSVAAGDERVGAEDDQTCPKRPAIIRQETDWILSYYQQAGMESEVDNEDPPKEENQWTGAPRASTPSSTSSGSISAYSFEDDEPTTSSPARNESSEQGQGRTMDNLGSASSSRPHQPRDNGERRNAGRRPSELSADRRRIAVIELNPIPLLNRRRGQRPSINTTTTASSDQPRFANPRLAKKATGFALVAPPDASPAAYTDLTPPSSAPAHITITPGTELPSDFKHKRSVSDTLDARVSPHKSPRDVGIVGQLDDTPSITRKSSGDIQSYFDIQGSKVPVFQTPHRSPMPSPIPESVTASPQCPPTHPGLLTPEIGEAKDIHKPVVGPVIVDVNGAMREKSGSLLTPSFTPSVPSSYLYYQPGVHSVAGPPPPMITRPSRGENVGPTSPPPRPPRLHTPVISSSASNPNLRHAKEQSSTLPAPKPSQLSPTKSGESAPANDPSREAVGSAPGATGDVVCESSPLSKPFHIREGAFPPSTTGSLSPTLPPELTPENSVSSVVSSSPSVESIPPPTPHKDDPLPVPARPLSRSASTSTSRSNIPRLPRSRPVSMHSKFAEIIDPSSVPSGSPVIDEKPLPSPTVEAFTKRFSSLPRAPSVSSGSNLSRGYSRTPSPLPPRRRKRVIEQWPLAMQYKDVLECKTPLERSLGYARKINELAMYDCGLTSWMDAVRARALPKKTPSRSKPTLNLGRNMPSSYKEPPEGRKVSGGSFESGTTFPMRPDAHSATDLSMRTNDVPARMEDLVTKAPVLPYPSLAPMTRTSTQSSTLTSPPSSMRSLPLSASKSAGGFFSSIGRKTSIRRDKEKRPPSPVKMSPKKVGTPPQQKPMRLPQISTPHIIGGPRAIPGRSQSIIAHPAARPEETQKRFDHKRRSTVSGRRPSLAPPPPSKSMPPPPSPSSHNAHHISLPPSSHKRGQTPGQVMFPDPQFNVQLDKLVHLLPHVNRNVLAGYLRRSGQDILAVGRYLEDEKNGSIVYH